ncbi:hypothetical protein CSB45_00670 [candidate division KSB3 bacterium]|uniref:Uncharacterized protein n=1 Tax=candidate division KSB3 bacterium TaxID=2044937 RepID=A0A2G6ED41_9BACT|nr:MAG: hypothetical protein CSB45_00670 [candidate division KSB3 bacterium]
MHKSAANAKLTGNFCLLLGILCNKFVLEAVFSSDGKIDALSVNIGLILLQFSLISAGILYRKEAYAALTKVGFAMLLLFISQFWVRVFLELPFPEKRMFKALPQPITLFEAGTGYQDQISLYEDRFDELKALLPSAGRVGYVTSQHLSHEEAKFHYGLTTYTLAPLHVEHTTSHDYVIGNFPDFNRNSLIPEFEHLRLLKDFKNGVVLLTGKTLQ